MPYSLEGGRLRIPMDGDTMFSNTVDLSWVPGDIRRGLLDGSILIPDSAVSIEPQHDIDNIHVAVNVRMDDLIYTNKAEVAEQKPSKVKRSYKRKIVI